MGERLRKNAAVELLGWPDADDASECGREVHDADGLGVAPGFDPGAKEDQGNVGVVVMRLP
jgi:hypothetical protein